MSSIGFSTALAVDIGGYTVRTPSTFTITLGSTSYNYSDMVSTVSDSVIPISFTNGYGYKLSGVFQVDFPVVVGNSSDSQSVLFFFQSVLYWAYSPSNNSLQGFNMGKYVAPTSMSLLLTYADGSTSTVSCSSYSSGALPSYGALVSVPAGKYVSKATVSVSFPTSHTFATNDSKVISFAFLPSVEVVASSNVTDVSGVEAILRSILSSSERIQSMLTPTPQQSSTASQYVQDMGELQDQIDEANQTIEDNTNRPSADALVPATPDIIQDGVIGGGDAAATAMMDDFGSLLASPLILNVLVLVFTLAFLSYVLFGKKG